MKNIIVTGAAGYIGAHTLVELMNTDNYQPIALDNYSNSSPPNYRGVELLTGKTVFKHTVDLTNFDALETVLEQYPKIHAIIHFAAFKSVPESVQKPLEYYRNNIGGLNNLLILARKFRIPNFIFSSSCAVYGNTETSLISEDLPMGKAESPYAYTKQIGEQMLADFAHVKKWFNYYALRYFNPAGYHPTGLLGENPKQAPQSLVPVVCTAAAKQKKLTIFGNEYPTPDGTCIRDYVHVCDIARAHVLALDKMLEHTNSRSTSPREQQNEILNLGSGKGYSVMEVIAAFERNNLVRVPYIIGPKRAGDLVSIFASNEKAKELLEWNTRYSLDDMVKSAWEFHQKNAYLDKKTTLLDERP